MQRLSRVHPRHIAEIQPIANRQRAGEHRRKHAPAPVGQLLLANIFRLKGAPRADLIADGAQYVAQVRDGGRVIGLQSDGGAIGLQRLARFASDARVVAQAQPAVGRFLRVNRGGVERQCASPVAARPRNIGALRIPATRKVLRGPAPWVGKQECKSHQRGHWQQGKG